jgi:hypothetical protein
MINIHKIVKNRANRNKKKNKKNQIIRMDLFSLIKIIFIKKQKKALT